MEDENNIQPIIQIVKIILILAVFLIIAIPIYHKIQTSINNNNFTQYLKNSGYKQNKYNIYTKTQKNSINETKAFTKEYVMYQAIYTETEDTTSTLELQYNYNNTVTVTYHKEVMNDNGDDVLIQSGIYKNKKFTCKITATNGLDTECKMMQKKAKNYYQNITQILKNNKINPKYLQSNTKNR